MEFKAAEGKIVETIKRNIKRRPSMQNIFETINKSVGKDTIDWIDISLFKDAKSNLENEGLIYSEEVNGCYYIKNQNASYISEHAINKLFEEVVSKKLKGLIKTEPNERLSDKYISDYENMWYDSELISWLRNKIAFLRSELQSKNMIIEMLVKERNNCSDEKIETHSFPKNQWHVVPKNKLKKSKDISLKIKIV